MNFVHDVMNLAHESFSTGSLKVAFSIDFDVINLNIRDDGLDGWRPVAHVIDSFDASLLQGFSKGRVHGLRMAFAHGEAGPVPVERGTQFFQLHEDHVAFRPPP